MDGAQGLVTEPELQKSRGRRRASVIIGSLLAAVLVLALGGMVWWENATAAAAQQSAAALASAKAAADASASASASAAAKAAADAAAEAEQEARSRAAASAQAEADRQASVKSQMEAQGWTQATGYSYYRFADPSTCDGMPCAFVGVVSMAPQGCPGGFYVEASIERSGISIGMANGVTATLAQGKVAVVKLQDATGTGGGNTFALTQVTCHGG